MMDMLRIALRNIKKRKKRTALTMLGIFVGIAAVVALVSLGQGFEKTVEQQFEKVGVDKIIIQAKDVGYGGTDAPGKLTKHTIDVVDRVQGVEQVTGQIATAARIVYNDLQRTMLMFSIPDNAQEVELVDEFSTWEAEKGRLLTHKDKRKTAIGYNVAEKSFRKSIRLGQDILVNDEEYEVVGVFEKTGDPGMDNGVAIPEEDVRRMIEDEEVYSYIVAKTAANEDPETIAEKIEREIRKDRHQKKGEEDFKAETSTELIESFMQILGIIQAVFVGIALISLLVGGIGIMNTMFTAVLERTKEIAVMKSIGATNKDIMTIFLGESAMLGFAGGVIGVLIGVAISASVSIVVNGAFGPNTLNAYFSPVLIIGTLAFSTLIGMISGYFPARRASRLQPADALRYQ